ncbi:MAG: BatD family protein [Verrucomicrobiae bacterium]|nr:BatD family protein [Verrucomicrobiae bacterium]
MTDQIEMAELHGQPVIKLQTPDGAVALISLFGAQLLSWTPAGGEDRLYLSPKAVFDGQTAIRGGVPLCFPQFAGEGPLPKHGFARNKQWAVSGSRAGKDFAVTTLQLVDDADTRALWPHAFAAEMSISIGGGRLDMELEVTNTGDAPFSFTAALHTYLKVREVSVPALGGDAFTVAPVPRQPTQTTENVNGIPYNVLTWSTTISAVKSGEHPLDSRIQLAVLQPTRHRLRDVFGGDFFDNFFGNDFFGGFEAKTVSVASSPTSLKALPLPEEGRPDTFSGAVGHFELRAEADPRQVVAGDPITLRFTLRGNGNLERLQAPRLADSAKWKTYPSNARPSPDGSEKDAAQRAFEQAVIPLDAAVQTVPPVSWSYFDPEARRYVTLTTPALPLKVLPPAHAATSSPAASPEAPPPPPTEEERALAEASSWARRAAGRLLLLGQKPAFWLALLVPLVSFSAGRRAWESIRRRRQDPLHLRRLAASRAVRCALAELDAAQQRGDSSLFFAAAGRALREQLAARFHLNSASLVLRDVEPHLNGRPELLGEIRRLFETADAAAFAGVGTDAAALAEWKARLASCLEQISAR